MKFFGFMPDLLILFDKLKKKNRIFSHFPFIFNWGHIDPKDNINKFFFYMPLESSPVFFVCVQRDKVGKVPKIYSTEMKGTIFIYSRKVDWGHVIPQGLQ